MPTAIPTSSTIEEVVLSMGTQWPGMASSEIAEITAVPASSSGMPAATSAPKTSSSKTSVTGTEVTSALRKSCPVMLPTALVRLASPASSIFSPGCLAATEATALSVGATSVDPLSLESRVTTVNVTRADRPLVIPGLVSGERMSLAEWGSARSAVTTSAVACRSSGSLA